MTTRKYTHEEIIANKDIKERLRMITHNQKIEAQERQPIKQVVLCDRPLTKEDYIKELKNRQFAIEMIDHWTMEDRTMLYEIERELARVER